MSDVIDRDTASIVSGRIRAFGQPHRMMILSALLGGERTVAQVDALTGIGQPALSQQLAELRRAELVVQRRDAKTVIYRLADARVADLVRILIAACRDGADAGTDLLALLERRPDPAPRPRYEPSAAVFARIEKG